MLPTTSFLLMVAFLQGPFSVVAQEVEKRQDKTKTVAVTEVGWMRADEKGLIKFLVHKETGAVRAVRFFKLKGEFPSEFPRPDTLFGMDASPQISEAAAAQGGLRV
jgi:hypothetical protein